MRQLWRAAQLYIVIPGDRIADNDVLIYITAVSWRRGGYHHRTTGKAICRSVDGEGAGLVRGLHHSDQLASAGVAGEALVGSVIRLAAVVHAEDFAVAGDGERTETSSVLTSRPSASLTLMVM